MERSSSPPERLRQALRQIGPLLKGSLVEVRLRCGTAGCRCHRGGPKHPGVYFSYRYRGASHTVYIPKAAQKEARRASANWHRLKAIVEALTTAEVDRLQGAKRRSPKHRKERRR